MARKKICGVYKIQSRIKPQRFYVGSSQNIIKRFNEHKRALLGNKHHSHKLQRHYNKYGIEDLDFLIIEEFDFVSRKHIIDKEQSYLDGLHPYFNESMVANSRAGVKASPETRKKQSEKSKGVKKSPEHRRKIGDAHRGIKFDKEFGEKISKARKGKKMKPFTPEHRANLSKALTGRKSTISPEQIAKQIAHLAEINKGKKETPEQCAEKSIRMTEYWATHPHRKHTEEEKKKCGRPQSPERIAEIKEWWRIRKENGWAANKESQKRERDEFGRFKKKDKT